MTMPIFNAVLVAKAPRKFPEGDVYAAFNALHEQIKKYPTSASRYDRDYKALEAVIEHIEEAERGHDAMADEAEPRPMSFQDAIAMVIARDLQPAGVDETPRPMPQPKPVEAKVEAPRQPLASGSFPLSAAFHVAEWACDFVPETLVDAICSIQQLKPQTLEDRRKRESALRNLHKALAMRQEERMAAGAYGA